VPTSFLQRLHPTFEAAKEVDAGEVVRFLVDLDYT
jgi:hypothetical protein